MKTSLYPSQNQLYFLLSASKRPTRAAQLAHNSPPIVRTQSRDRSLTSNHETLPRRLRSHPKPAIPSTRPN